MEYKEYRKLIKEKWLRENCKQSQFLAPYIFRLKPEIGFVIDVDKLEIPKDLFKEEYKQITKAYLSVLKKLDEYYKENVINSDFKE